MRATREHISNPTKAVLGFDRHWDLSGSDWCSAKLIDCDWSSVICQRPTTPSAFKINMNNGFLIAKINVGCLAIRKCQEINRPINMIIIISTNYTLNFAWQSELIKFNSLCVWFKHNWFMRLLYTYIMTKSPRIYSCMSSIRFTAQMPTPRNFGR